MNLKEFTIGTILAVMIITLGGVFVSGVTSGSGYSMPAYNGISFNGIESKSYEILNKINETAEAGIVSITGAYNIITMPITIVGLALEMTFQTFGIVTAMIAQVTGIPTIVISGVFVIFAVWVVWEAIRLIWGRS